MKCKETELTPFGHAVAGSCAAFFSSIVVCPTEMIKNRMQAASELAKSGKFSFDKKITITSTTKQIMSEVNNCQRGIACKKYVSWCKI